MVPFLLMNELMKSFNNSCCLCLPHDKQHSMNNSCFLCLPSYKQQNHWTITVAFYPLLTNKLLHFFLKYMCCNLLWSPIFQRMQMESKQLLCLPPSWMNGKRVNISCYAFLPLQWWEDLACNNCAVPSLPHRWINKRTNN